MKHIIFERIMLCVIAAGIWTIAGLYIYDRNQNKKVEVTKMPYVYGEVEVTNDVDVNVLDY